MSDAPHGYGWWRASDDLWYPPEDHPDYRPPPPPAPPPSAEAGTVEQGVVEGPAPVAGGSEAGMPDPTVAEGGSDSEPLFLSTPDDGPVPAGGSVTRDLERRATRRVERRKRRRRRRIVGAVAIAALLVVGIAVAVTVARDGSENGTAAGDTSVLLGRVACDDLLSTFRISADGATISFTWETARELDPILHTLYATAVTDDGSEFEVGVRSDDGSVEGFVYDATDESDTLIPAASDSGTVAGLDIDRGALPRDPADAGWVATVTEAGREVALCPAEGDLTLD